MSVSILRSGASGPSVKELQTLLNQKSSPSPGLAVDGQFGPATRAAVEKFQKQKWLVVDGEVELKCRRCKRVWRIAIAAAPAHPEAGGRLTPRRPAAAIGRPPAAASPARWLAPGCRARRPDLRQYTGWFA